MRSGAVKKIILAALTAALAVAGCAQKTSAPAENPVEVSTSAETASVPETEEKSEDSSNTASTASQVASASEMADVEEVVEAGMIPVTADKLNDGVYEVKVDSSSSMFNIEACELTVLDGEMTAVMTMGGTGYLYVYMGTGEEAVNADAGKFIPFEENTEGAHTFTVPVSALDEGISCSAFSKRKEKWYDRTLLFRADSLPDEAFKESRYRTAEDLMLGDGQYLADVSLEGGSGRASVHSPAQLTISEGACTAVIVWSSSNYDYMTVDGEKYLPVNTEGNSTFEIPVKGFDYKMPVTADTTAMSTPHEIEYTLYFDSASVRENEK